MVESNGCYVAIIVILMIVGIVLIITGSVFLWGYSTPDTQQEWMWAVFGFGIVAFVVGLAILIWYAVKKSQHRHHMVAVPAAPIVVETSGPVEIVA